MRMATDCKMAISLDTFELLLYFQILVLLCSKAAHITVYLAIFLYSDRLILKTYMGGIKALPVLYIWYI